MLHTFVKRFLALFSFLGVVSTVGVCSKFTILRNPLMYKHPFFEILCQQKSQDFNVFLVSGGEIQLSTNLFCTRSPFVPHMLQMKYPEDESPPDELGRWAYLWSGLPVNFESLGTLAQVDTLSVVPSTMLQLTSPIDSFRWLG